MESITVCSVTGGSGFGPVMSGLRLAAKSFLWCFIFLMPAFAIAAQAVNHPLAEGDSSGILPVSLGKPEGCIWTTAEAMNSGMYPEELVIAGYVTCPSGQHPFQWRAGSWSPLEMPEGAYAGGIGFSESVNDDPGREPTFTYRILNDRNGEDYYVLSPGQPPIMLQMLPDMVGGENAVLSAQGNHIAGANKAGDGISAYTYRAVRWTREGDGWSAPQDLAPGRAVSTTEDGSVVVGNANADALQYSAEPWVWSDGGELTMLDPEAMVSDITHDGSMIVGSRAKPCSNPENCDFFPAPVYWVQEQGAWVMHDLEALDGVNSIAQAVAIVDGSAIIVGYGYTAQDGGILRPVACIPRDDGSYGAPLRLEALGANFNSWSEAVDINRNGQVIGWSEIEPYSGETSVVWSLFESLPFQINGGISDAWYDPATDGQGFFITVLESVHTIFLAWFTYDTVRPDDPSAAVLGDPGHRWMTAQGSYADNRADLEITFTEGGIFDSGTPTPVRRQDGTMTLEFSNCISGTVSYDIPSIGWQGVVPIQRVSQANVANCERLAIPTQ